MMRSTTTMASTKDLPAPTVLHQQGTIGVAMTAMKTAAATTTSLKSHILNIDCMQLKKMEIATAVPYKMTNKRMFSSMSQLPTTSSREQEDEEQRHQRNLLGYDEEPSSSDCCWSSHRRFSTGDVFKDGPPGDGEESPFKRRRRFQRRNSKTAAMLLRSLPMPTMSSMVAENSDSDEGETATASPASNSNYYRTNQLSKNKWDHEMKIAHGLVRQLLKQKREQQERQRQRLQQLQQQLELLQQQQQQHES